jgi:sec-independent protein translocase protein TatB
MFDISWGELLLIGMVALIVIGPKELPSVLRAVGQWMTKLRRMANEFQGQFQEAIREAEMADLKKEVDEMTEKAKSYANFDPLGDVQKDIEKTLADPPPQPVQANPEQAADPALAEPAAAAQTSAVIASATDLSAHTPADVATPVENAMRVAAELNAPSAEVEAAAPAPVEAYTPPPVEVSTPAPVVEASALPPVAPVEPAPYVAPQPSPTPAPAKATDEDDWPAPATFREPLPKRSAGST